MSLRQTLAALPRDARDTLFLLAVIAWVIAPQTDVLPPRPPVRPALICGPVMPGAGGKGNVAAGQFQRTANHFRI